MLSRLDQLDRRWIFLAMLLTVATPILTGSVLPETPGEKSRALFDRMEALPAGARLLLMLDYEPPTEGELSPMTTAFLRHACLKRHKIVLATLWPTGLPLCDKNIRTTLRGEFASLNLQEGVDYANLGYRPGNEVAIKMLASDLPEVFANDINGTPVADLPIMRGITKAADFDLVIDVSAGYPGGKEWVQYGASTGLTLAVGCTGVQVPQMTPYYPQQIVGLLEAIRGAAEYERLLADRYPQQVSLSRSVATQRMGPQFYGHLLMVGLIVLGNVIHLSQRWQRRAPRRAA